MKKLILFISLVLSSSLIANAQCIEPTATVSQNFTGAVLSSFDVTVTNHSQSVQYYIFTYYADGVAVNTINSTSPNVNFPIYLNGSIAIHNVTVQAYCWDGTDSEIVDYPLIDIATVADVSGFPHHGNSRKYDNVLDSPCNGFFELVYVKDLDLHFKVSCYCKTLTSYRGAHIILEDSYYSHFGIEPIPDGFKGAFWVVLIAVDDCEEEVKKSIEFNQLGSGVELPSNPLYRGQSVALDIEVTEILLVNRIGKTCFTKDRLSLNESIIIPSNISTGMYFMIVKKDGQYSSQKVMIE